MNNNDIIENNTLIAEFMGMKIIDDGITKHFYYQSPEFTNGNRTPQPKSKCVIAVNNIYNTSWDWLMPVVSKLTSLSVFHNDYDENESFWETYNQIDLKEIYEEVVKFIKWFNTQNS